MTFQENKLNMMFLTILGNYGIKGKNIEHYLIFLNNAQQKLYCGKQIKFNGLNNNSINTLTVIRRSHS